MADYTKTTGTTGVLRISDNGDLVEFAIRSHSPLSLAQLPWTYKHGETEEPWKSFNFQNTTEWQRLGLYRVTASEDVTLKIGYTNTSLGGPTELTQNIYRTPPPSEQDPGSPEAPVRIRGAIIQVGEQQYHALGYINVNGVWKRMETWAKSAGVWKETI